MEVNNIFSKIPSFRSEEVIEVILKTESFCLERIISYGHATPPGEWYDQETDEWVLLLKGSAGIRFEGHPEIQTMGPGDSLRIPAHLRHRVEWTEKGVPTVWLALHYPAVSPDVRRSGGGMNEK